MGIVQDSLQVVKVASRLANPELLERVTSLNEQVLELSSKNVDLQERVFQLEREVQRANEKLHLIGEVQRRDGFIYHAPEADPCCSHCFDSDRILIRVVEAVDGPHAYCPHCRTSFGGRRPKGLRSSRVR